MAKLNYSSFANIIYKHMIKKDMTAISMSFFHFLIEEPNYIKNENGDVYCWNSREAGEWFRCETDIYPNLRSAAARQNIIDMAPNYIGDAVEELIYENQVKSLISELYELVQSDSSIPNDILGSIKQDYEDEYDYEFISKVFLYSVTQDNTLNHKKRSSKKKVEKLSLDDVIAGIRGAMAKLPRPIVIEVPDDLDSSEMIYVEALLKAYGDKENVVIATREELKTYKELDKNFSRQRKAYYAAESVRESVRDTFQDKDYKAFDEFKKDIYDGVIDVIEDAHPNGFARLNKTMTQAVNVPLNSLLSMLPGWITPEVKKGTCHMLVNDGDIKWVAEDE